ncbi:MAG: hypothetical protein L7G97_03955 [Acidilobus sp.]|nr:hypothetical protein [Acidilobus sp.]MCG2889929.1 hypothetical protein [Acidilobus sp.]
MAGLALGLLRDRGEELVVTRRGLYAISYLMKAFYIKISQIRAMAIRKGIQAVEKLLCFS